MGKNYTRKLPEISTVLLFFMLLVSNCVNTFAIAIIYKNISLSAVLPWSFCCCFIKISVVAFNVKYEVISTPSVFYIAYADPKLQIM